MSFISKLFGSKTTYPIIPGTDDYENKARIHVLSTNSHVTTIEFSYDDSVDMSAIIDMFRPRNKTVKYISLNNNVDGKWNGNTMFTVDYIVKVWIEKV